MSTRVAFVLWLKCCLSLRSWWRDYQTCTLYPFCKSPYLIWRWHARYLASHCKLTHWPLGDLDSLWKVLFSILFYWLVSSHLLTIMPSDECHGTYLKISQNWFRQWLGAIRQQVITWANVDPDLRHHMASLGHNELTGQTQIQWITALLPDSLWIVGASQIVLQNNIEIDSGLWLFWIMIQSTIMVWEYHIGVWISW